MKYVYLFLPAIGWGLMPLVIASVKNSTVYNQIVGTVAASFIFGAIVMAIMHPAMSWSLFLLSALGGACWVIGQVGQYISYEKIGVSETMPISTGLQLIGVPLELNACRFQLSPMHVHYYYHYYTLFIIYYNNYI